MRIEILYFDGCPNYFTTKERVMEALHLEGLSAEVVAVLVPGSEAAQLLRFLGSPTVHIDGIDIEREARALKDFGLMCRTYLENGTRVGAPPVDLIRAALREDTGPARGEHACCEAQARSPQSTDFGASKGRRLLLGSSVAAALAASLCCIVPIVASVTGLGLIAAGTVFEQWRPYLLGVTGLLLAGGFLLAYRDHRKSCAPGSACAAKPLGRWNLIALLGVTALAGGLAAFPSYSGLVAKAVISAPASPSVSRAVLSTVTFQIPDMDCPACAVSLSATLQKLPGVADANLDVGSRKATLTFDPASQSAAGLGKVISDAGFHPTREPHS